MDTGAVTVSGKVKQSGRSAETPLVLILFKYAVYFAACLVLWRAKTGFINSFATGFYWALLFLGENPFVLLPLYILSALAVSFSFNTVISAVIASVVATASVLLFKKLNRELSLPIMLLSGAVSYGGFIYFGAVNGGRWLTVGLNLIFALIFMYVTMCALKPVTVYKLARKPLDTELAALAIVFGVICLGFASLGFFKLKPLYALMMFVVASASFLLGRGGALVSAVAAGLGSALFNYDVTAIALFAFTGAVLTMFTGAPRILSVLAGIMAAVVFELYFNVDSSEILFDLGSLCAGGVLYAVIPKKRFVELKNKYFAPHDKLAERSLINGSRSETGEEVKKVSSIFGEMGRALRNSACPVGYSPDEIYRTMSGGICFRCDRREECDAEEAVKHLSRIASDGERTNVGDVPYLIETDCPHVARLLSVAGEYADSVTRRRETADKDAKLRGELAEELEGVETILSETARIAALPVGYEPEKEQLLLEELSYRGVNATDALVTSGALDKVTLIVKGSDADGKTIADVVGKVLKSEFTVVSVKPAAIAGYSAVKLTERTDYDAVFASSNLSKSKEATGDTHSFIRISDTKFMMALCDGMGSGSKAGRVSETAIDLVESFFRAGFDSDFILKNVNRFLSYETDESFAAFDILVCDLNSLERSIIKLGAPASYIAGGAGVARIEGNSLPLGALGEVTPSVYTDAAANGETVVFVSDGISDLFKNDELARFIGLKASLPVKTLCEEIVDRAKELGGGAVTDDMTVTAARIMRRV